MLTPHTFTAPSLWASYLINGDPSGLELADIAACDKWLAWLDIRMPGIGAPVSCDDAGWLGSRFDAYTFYRYHCDCQTYTFLMEEPNAEEAT